MKDRADKVLVDLGHAPTRAQAKSLIEMGRIKVDGKVLTKASATLDATSNVEVEGGGRVGRGAYKLEAALAEFPVVVNDQILLDVGASTGGFTEILLEQGAARVFAVDVGYGQLAEKLRGDSRVVNMEGTHILATDALPEKIAGAVIDLSFISLIKVLKHVRKLLVPGGWIIALIKPQFEAGPERLPKDGVIKDVALRETILQEVLSFARDNAFRVEGQIISPVEGKSGNTEYLVWLGT